MMNPDPVETLIQTAGRRPEPPPHAYDAVLAAASATFREKVSRRRQRRWMAGAAAAASLVLAVSLVVYWMLPSGPGAEVATIERAIGGVEVAHIDEWQPLAEGRSSLGTGRRLRTRQDGRVSLTLAGGASLRLAGDTEMLLDGPSRLYVPRGTIYFDSGLHAAIARIEVVTPAGTARDVGTQFELQVDGTRLRLRVREGQVAVDRGGHSLTGIAGEQLLIDDLGGVTRAPIAADDESWQWAEALAPVPDVDGQPASTLIAWVARETGKGLRYESALVEQRAASVILHGSIRHLPPLAALEAMLATTDLEYVLDGDTIEVRTRNAPAQEP